MTQKRLTLHTYLSIAFLSLFVAFVVTQFNLSSFADRNQASIEEISQSNQILEELIHREADFSAIYSSLRRSFSTTEQELENFKYQFIVKAVSKKTDSPPPEC